VETVVAEVNKVADEASPQAVTPTATPVTAASATTPNTQARKQRRANSRAKATPYAKPSTKTITTASTAASSSTPKPKTPALVVRSQMSLHRVSKLILVNIPDVDFVASLAKASGEASPNSSGTTAYQSCLRDCHFREVSQR
jgi:hypothetical protein